MNKILFLMGLCDLLSERAHARYGMMWVYMLRTFLQISDGRVDPVLAMRMALVACEQVRKMAEVAYDVPLEERYANR